MSTSSPALATVTARGDLTSHVTGWCDALDLATLDPAILEVVRHCVLDWLAVTVAGAHEPVTDLLCDEIGPLASAGPATVIGRERGARVTDAAFVNGTASHALDYDDVHLSMPGHPSAPVFAALFAVAEDAALDGERFLRAAVCGLEAELRLGELAEPDHYERGWHATATLGTIGAAIACAEALGADTTQRRHAIGLAVAQVAGVKSMFGTMAKPAQVGRAAANGALAARLAIRGMTAAPAALDDPQGFLPLYSSWTGEADVFDEDRFRIPETLFKYHAACYFTHAGIEAAAELRPRLEGRRIETIELEVCPQNLTVCDIRRPSTGLETKFSMAATTSMALLGRDTGSPDAYDDASTDDRDLATLLDRISVTPNDSYGRTQMSVHVQLDDGNRLSATADAGTAERDLPHQRDRLEEKCRRLVGRSLGRGAADRMIELVHRLPDLDDLSAITAATLPSA